MSERIVPFIRGMKAGLGYDTLAGDISASPVVQGSSITALAGSKGQEASLQCLIISDIETLHKAVGVTVDAGGSYAGISGSAKVDYMNSFDFSRFSTYVLVRVSVRNALESMDRPTFSPDALELLQLRNNERFHRRFGDCFISGVQNGGEYFAIYQVSGTDSAETEQTATDVRLAFGNETLGANLHTKIETNVAKSSSHLEVNVFVFRLGTIARADLSLEDIMKTAREFPLSVAGEQSFPFEVVLQQYERLHNPFDGLDFLQIQNQKDVLADLAKKRFEFLALRDDYAYILKHLDRFKNSDGSPVVREALIQSHAQVVAAINTMETQASACSRDASKCEFTPFDTALLQVPVLAEIEKSDADVLVARGEAAVAKDARALQIRNDLPDAESQRGFNYAFGLAGDDKLPGPGKDEHRERLPSAQRAGFSTAVSYFLVRNFNAELVAIGEKIAAATKEVAAARSSKADGFFALGFDLATAIYGDPALGGQGVTSPIPGLGQVRIRSSLNDRGQAGYDASKKLHQGPPALPRRG